MNSTATGIAPLTADVIARKLDNASHAAGKFDWTEPPGDEPADVSTFYVHLEGKRYKVTVEDLGAEDLEEN